MLPAITLCVVLFFGLSPVAVLAAQAGDETTAPVQDAADFTAAVEQLGSAASYSFRRTRTDEGGGFGGGGRGGRGGGGGPGGSDGTAEIDGRFEQDKPLQLTAGETEAWRKGETLVHRTGTSGSWERFEMPARGEGGFGGRGGGGGGRGGFGAMRSMMTLQSVRMPHEILATLAEAAGTMTRTEEGGHTVFSGSLGPAAAAAVGGGMGRRMGGGRGGDFDVSGTYRVELDTEGHIAKAVFDTTTRGSFFDREFERTAHTEYSLSDIGSTEVAVPDDAAAALAGKTVAASSDDDHDDDGDDDGDGDDDDDGADGDDDDDGDDHDDDDNDGERA